MKYETRWNLSKKDLFLLFLQLYLRAQGGADFEAGKLNGERLINDLFWFLVVSVLAGRC